MMIPPTKLYWYRSLADDRRSWAREVIRDSTLYLSAPAEYNDLFEFQFRFDFDAPREQMVVVFTKHLMLTEGLSRQEAQQQAVVMATPPPGFSRRQFAAHMEQGLGASLRQEHLQQTGVISLTELDRHPLMWAHYADQHKGLCLEFDTTKGIGSNPIAAALDVTYQQRVPVVSWFVASEEERVRGIFLTKSPDWEYEREHRVVVPSRAGTTIPYPPEALTGIIFGTRIVPEVEAEVSEWVVGRDPPVELRRVRATKDKYTLEIDTVDTNRK